MDVLDDDDERPLAGDLFEQPPHRPERLAPWRCRRGGPHRAEHPRCDQFAVLDAGERSVHACVAAERIDDPDERPERDPVTVGETASGQDPDLVSLGRA